VPSSKRRCGRSARSKSRVSGRLRHKSDGLLKSVGNIGQGDEEEETAGHTHTHTHTRVCLLRSQVRGRVIHLPPISQLQLFMFGRKHWQCFVNLSFARVCVCVCVGHAQLVAALARGCLIGRLQVITCPSILPNCQIISSVTAAIVTLLSPLCSGHFHGEPFQRLQAEILASHTCTVGAEWTSFSHTCVCVCVCLGIHFSRSR